MNQRTRGVIKSAQSILVAFGNSADRINPVWPCTIQGGSGSSRKHGRGHTIVLYVIQLAVDCLRAYFFSRGFIKRQGSQSMLMCVNFAGIEAKTGLCNPVSSDHGEAPRSRPK